jgi:hypothetical protein
MKNLIDKENAFVWILYLIQEVQLINKNLPSPF